MPPLYLSNPAKHPQRVTNRYGLEVYDATLYVELTIRRQRRPRL